MNFKIAEIIIISMLSMNITGYSNTSESKNQIITTPKTESTAETAPDTKEENSLIPTNTSEPFVGIMPLDSETEKFFYGTWKVDKLLGFANSYNDASEYPTGQDVIGDEIIINKDTFSSMGFENYDVYQYELEDPIYEITEICYNEDSFYRIFKMDLPGIDMNDEIKAIRISDSSTGLSIPMGFLDVNDDKLILILEATAFELTRVAE